MIALAEEIGALTLTANPSPRGVNCATPEATVALVFADDDPDELLGIFTDADYIKLAMERAGACDVEESAAFVAAPVSNFVTPAGRLVCVDESSTASQAVAVMTANNIRHAVVLDECGPNFTYRPEGRLRGSSACRTCSG